MLSGKTIWIGFVLLFKMVFINFPKRTKPKRLVGLNPTGPAEPGPTDRVGLAWPGLGQPHPALISLTLSSHTHAHQHNSFPSRTWCGHRAAAAPGLPSTSSGAAAARYFSDPMFPCTPSFSICLSWPRSLAPTLRTLVVADATPAGIGRLRRRRFLLLLRSLTSTEVLRSWLCSCFYPASPSTCACRTAASCKLGVPFNPLSSDAAAVVAMPLCWSTPHPRRR
jgi:hypothetical protein